MMCFSGFLPPRCVLVAMATIACAPGEGETVRTPRDVAAAADSQASPKKLTAEVPLTQVPDTLWLLGADPSADVVRISDSEDSLIVRHGAENVVRGEIHIGDGMTVPGTVLFPNDPLRRLEVRWTDIEARRWPMSVDVLGTAWRIPPGIGLGTTLQEVEAHNGGPFELAGFEGPDQGWATGWLLGRLGSYREQYGRGHWAPHLRLLPHAPQSPDSDERSFEGGKSYPTSSPALQRLRLRVTSLVLYVPEGVTYDPDA